jgi:hypothetical protein
LFGIIVLPIRISKPPGLEATRDATGFEGLILDPMQVLLITNLKAPTVIGRHVYLVIVKRNPSFDVSEPAKLESLWQAA